MNKKILITTLLLSCASVKLLCMDPSLMLMSGAAPKDSVNSKSKLDLNTINTQIEQIDKELATLSKDKSQKALLDNAPKKRNLQSKRAELVTKKQMLEKK